MNEKRLAELYDAHARELIGFFARRTGDPQLALDLLGDTFVSAFEQRGTCRGQTNREQAAWLSAIAVNKLTDHYRRGAAERRATERLTSELRALHQHEIATIMELGATNRHEERVHAAFNDLSDEQRNAIRLRVIDEQPYPEVSRELGISEPAARARVRRGLRTLLRVLAGDRKEKA